MWIRTEIKWNRYWKLTALWEREYRTTPKWKKLIYEKCVCDCWKEHRIQRWTLLNWITRSCWCLSKETSYKNLLHPTHWMTWTRFYKIYYGIEWRCTREKEASRCRYWWIWIKNLWNSFEEFYNDMYEGYLEHVKQFWEKETTIDRIDPRWHYCKENCRWATNKEQSNNRRNTRKIIYNWKEYSGVHTFCEELWLNYKRVMYRMSKWWDLDKVVNCPKKWDILYDKQHKDVSIQW